MTAAEQIMEKKGLMKAELDRRTGKSDELWKKATEKLERILDEHGSRPKGVRIHTDSRIFPAAAVYLTVKEELGEQEYLSHARARAENKILFFHIFSKFSLQDYPHRPS